MPCRCQRRQQALELGAQEQRATGHARVPICTAGTQRRACAQQVAKHVLGRVGAAHRQQQLAPPLAQRQVVGRAARGKVRSVGGSQQRKAVRCQRFCQGTIIRFPVAQLPCKDAIGCQLVQELCQCWCCTVVSRHNLAIAVLALMCSVTAVEAGGQLGAGQGRLTQQLVQYWILAAGRR